MKERASALGGELEAGPRGDAAGGGFRVRARLPLDAAASTR
jgi:signal transduction histidine kinase